MQNHAKAVQKHAKSWGFNLNNAKAPSFYAKTCKNTQYFDTNHAKAHLVDAKSCKSSHSFDTKCTNHAKSCKSNAKSCKSTLFLIVALLLFLIKVQNCFDTNHVKAHISDKKECKSNSFACFCIRTKVFFESKGDFTFLMQNYAKTLGFGNKNAIAHVFDPKGCTK